MVLPSESKNLTLFSPPTHCSNVSRVVNYGYAGIDMMLYRNQKGDTCIHPLIEINPRYTMGHVALHVQNTTSIMDTVATVFAATAIVVVACEDAHHAADQH